MEPGEGPPGGGVTVLVRGSGFQPGAVASLGSRDLLDLEWLDAGTLRGRLPPHAPGTVDLRVRNPDGGEALLPGGFKYLPYQPQPLLILEARPWPNPGPRFLSVRLSSPAETVRVRAWTPALALAAEQRWPGREGWQRFPLDGLLQGLPNGLAYLTLEAFQGEVQTPPGAPISVYLLR